MSQSEPPKSSAGTVEGQPPEREEDRATRDSGGNIHIGPREPDIAGGVGIPIGPDGRLRPGESRFVGGSGGNVRDGPQTKSIWRMIKDWFS